MDDQSLKELSDKIDRLIHKCKLLEDDNAALKSLQDEWSQERMRLLQKNDLARSKIEAMISRLKALEQH